jgi:hypothetical protein
MIATMVTTIKATVAVSSTVTVIIKAIVVVALIIVASVVVTFVIPSFLVRIVMNLFTATVTFIYFISFNNALAFGRGAPALWPYTASPTISATTAFESSPTSSINVTVILTAAPSAAETASLTISTSTSWNEVVLLFYTFIALTAATMTRYSPRSTTSSSTSSLK